MSKVDPCSDSFLNGRRLWLIKEIVDRCEFSLICLKVHRLSTNTCSSHSFECVINVFYDKLACTTATDSPSVWLLSQRVNKRELID